jgi:Uma2 family endonuclease
MGSFARLVHYTIAEYLTLEEGNSTKHEFLAGEIYAMAGGSPDHAALASALVRCLSNRLPQTCRFFSSDLRIHCVASGLFTYADATIVCGPTERSATDRHAVVNPRVLFEITSPSTEDYDRGAKLRHYMQIPSVYSVVFVSHTGPRVTLHERQGNSDEWLVREFVGTERAVLSGIDLEMDLADLYRDPLEDS